VWGIVCGKGDEVQQGIVALQKEFVMATETHYANVTARPIHIRCEGAELAGDLCIPQGAIGLVLFVHGSGSSRHSPRNIAVAEQLQHAGLATLLFDLLTTAEEAIDDRTAELRFDIPLLSRRVVGVTSWLKRQTETKHLRLGYFGASTGAAAALVAAAELPSDVGAVVSRGGRPDLAGESLDGVRAPTLLIVGGNDLEVIDLNEQAMLCMRCPKKLQIVPGASHLFEERGSLEQVAQLARDWFGRYLSAKEAQG
jgi:putative phosphoribosyl transferase